MASGLLIMVLVIKSPVRLNYCFGLKGVVSAPLLIGGAVVVGIIVVLVATGALKFPAKVTTSGSSQNQAQLPGATPQLSPTPAPQGPKPSVKLAPEPYSDSQLGFSIQYPQDWKVRSETTGVTIYVPSANNSEKGDALVLVSTAPLGQLKGSKLTTIADLQKVQLKNQFSNMKIIKERETKIGDADAYETEFTATLKGENVHAKYFLLTTSADLYGILGSANEGMWSKYESYLDASISTFTLQ